jgi:hypothetical protein
MLFRVLLIRTWFTQHQFTLVHLEKSTPTNHLQNGNPQRRDFKNERFQEKKPNKELLEHEAKREVELSLIRLEAELDEKGW